MEPIAFTIAIYREVYNLSRFVYEVVQDVRDYDSDRDTIKQELEHEIFFLEAFNKFFLDQDSGGIVYDSNLPPTYPLRVTSILQHLRESLSVYSKLALKHYPPYRRLILGEDVQRSIGSISEKELPQQPERGDFRRKIQDLGLRAWDWSLFDKKKLLEVVSQFREWTGRLKEIMSFSMLFATRFKDVTALEDFQKSDTAKKTGLEKVANRQFLNRSKTVKEAPPLNGRLVESSYSAQGSAMRIMRFHTEIEPYGKAVAVEYKGYGLQPSPNEAIQQNLVKVKKNIRTLATILQNSAFVEDYSSRTTRNEPVLHTFQCIGYIDEPESNRMAFIFQLPTMASTASLGNLQTLHSFIEEVDTRKRPVNCLSLEQRFFLAHSLCITILNLHGSGWVHKSIRSTNVVLFPGDPTESPETLATSPSKAIPYITGFEFSRPALGATEVMVDFDIERNLYRHPDRQGSPMANFSKMHDLYALGVVLLEIGMWKSITSRLKAGIDHARKFGKLPPPEHIKQGLIKMAKEELPREMGTRYAKAVVTCLSSGFSVRKDDPQQRELGLAFREQVIEVMADGLKL